MRTLPLVLAFIAAVSGCSESTPPKHIQAWVDSWAEMGMYLPDKNQVAFLRANFADVAPELAAAVSHENPDVRQRAAHVIRELGKDAAPLGAALGAQLSREEDRLVRIYLYDALAATGYSDADTVKDLKRRYDSLSTENVSPQFNGSYPDVDERIKVAAALFVLTDSEMQTGYRDFVLGWLRPMPVGLSATERAGYWERRWMAVNALVDTPVGADAIPLLETMQSEDAAPSWVSVHVPRALETQRRIDDNR